MTFDLWQDRELRPEEMDGEFNFENLVEHSVKISG